MADEAQIATTNTAVAQRRRGRHISKIVKAEMLKRGESLVTKTLDAIEKRLESNDIQAVTIATRMLGMMQDNPSTVVNVNQNNLNHASSGRAERRGFERIIQMLDERDAARERPMSDVDVQDAEFEEVNADRPAQG